VRGFAARVGDYGRWQDGDKFTAPSAARIVEVK